MFRRISGASGLAFVLIFAFSQFTSGEPSRTATKEEITRFVASHQTSNEVGGALLMLVSGIFALFVVGVWSLVRSSQRDSNPGWPTTGLVGGIVMAVNLAFVGATVAAVGRLGDSLASQPILAQTVVISGQTLGTSILPFIALFLLGLGVATLESGGLPAWTAWLAFLGAALSVVLLLQLLYPGPVLDGVGIVQALVVVGWMAIIGVMMVLPQPERLVRSAQAT
jgi:hypothetical protein